MASPAVTRPPATLPANFDGWDKTPPQTLPADFSGWDKPAAAHTTKPQQGFFSSAADSSGLSGIAHAIAHPYDTITGIPGAIAGAARNAVTNAHDEVSALRTNGLTQETRRKLGGNVPIIGPTLAKAQAQHDSGNNAGMAGTLTGAVAGLAAPSAIKPAIPLAGGALEGVGQGMQGAGVDVINRTVGALKNDFARGVNPGRGYFDAGLGPSISMNSIADKAAAAKSATGAKIGSAIDAPIANIAKIPVQDVAGRLRGPMSKAFELENGPGGMGNTAPLEEYAGSFRPAIQGAAESGGFTPRGLFDLKKGIAANTNWSDPAQFNLKAVRQQQAGALGGLLEENVPGLEPLNRNYADLLKLSKRALTRAETGSSPLTTLAGKLGGGAIGGALGATHGTPGMLLGTALGLGADSVPVKTTLGSGLYYGGKGLSAVGTKLKRIGN